MVNSFGKYRYVCVEWGIEEGTFKILSPIFSVRHTKMRGRCHFWWIEKGGMQTLEVVFQPSYHMVDIDHCFGRCRCRGAYVGGK